MEKYLRIGMLVLGVFLVGSAIQAITKNRIAYYKQVEVATQEKIVAKNKELVALKDRERQLECLARNIYFESGTESFEGKVAVAQVSILISQTIFAK
jgi:spore germination cell wall hydrolase CwlJ-like protein